MGRATVDSCGVVWSAVVQRVDGWVEGGGRGFNSACVIGLGMCIWGNGGATAF